MPEIVFNEYMWKKGRRHSVITGKTGISGGEGSVYISSAIDALEPSADWSRVIIIADGEFEFSYLASDSKKVFINGEAVEFEELVLRQRFVGLRGEADNLWTATVESPTETPLTGAKGRYFWFMLKFNEDVRVKSLKLYFNIEPLTAYLPEFYDNNEFLSRFLALFQSFYTGLDNKILNVSEVLESGTAEGDVLIRLAQWAGVQEPSLWPADRLRKLIKNAHRLSHTKGTKACVADIIKLYTDKNPIIIEACHAQKYGYEPLYGEDKYTVTVLIDDDSGSAINCEKLAKVITYYKPMFVKVKIVLLTPCIMLGSHTYLGINSSLSISGASVLEGKAGIQYNFLAGD